MGVVIKNQAAAVCCRSKFNGVLPPKNFNQILLELSGLILHTQLYNPAIEMCCSIRNGVNGSHDGSDTNLNTLYRYNSLSIVPPFSC